MKQKKKKETKDAGGFIEIPFGAFDSETMGWTYTIPEGFTAKIEDGKIIVEKAESDDERIRKEMIDYFSQFKEDGIRGVDITPWIIYLEKQKDAEIEIEKAYKNADKIQYEKGFEDGVASVRPAEWSEDYREEDIQTRFAFYTYKDDPSVLYLSNVFVEETSRNHGFGTRILKAAEKAAEAIGAITICLKVKQNSPANTWYRKRGYGYMAFEDGYDWLQKKLEYLKPAKQVWSEEDEIKLASLINYFEGDALDCSTEDMVRWLKSLRPQPHWKPSEEQIDKLTLNL